MRIIPESQDDLIQKIIENNSAKKDALIQRVLIWNNSYDMYAYNEFVSSQVKSLFLTFYVFNECEIHVYDKDALGIMDLISHSEINSYLGNIKQHKVIENIDILSFDLIICNIKTEDLLYLELNKYPLDSFNLPIVFSLPDKVGGEKTTLPSIKEYLYQKFLSYSKKNKKEVQKLKLNFDDSSKINYTRSLIEKKYGHLIRRISQNNLLKQKIKYNKILVFDGYNRKFYLGDSFFWFNNIRKNVSLLGENSKVSVVMDYYKRYMKIHYLYNSSFPKNFSLMYKSIEELDLDKYDLVLCHTDSLGRFLAYLDDKLLQSNGLKLPSIYYINMDVSDVNDDFKWNYNILVERNFKLFFLENFLKLKKQIFNELVIRQDQIDFGGDWLKKENVMETDILIAMPHDASHIDKTLPERIFCEVILFLLRRNQAIKILIFDFKNTGLKANLLKLIGIEHQNRLIDLKRLSIHEEIGILCNEKVRYFISPCTGIAHLVNGAFTYLRNKSLVIKNQIPKIIVYTGKGATRDYTPHVWWRNTMVKCVVFVKEDVEHRLLDMKDCSKESTEYQKNAESLQKIEAKLFIEFLKGVIHVT